MKFLPSPPVTWDPRRAAELLVAFYATGLGIMLSVYPDTLAASHYGRMGGPAASWYLGTFMLAFAAGHSFALWLNGSAPAVSRQIRKYACLGHMAMTVYFTVEFAISGIYWGAWCMVIILILVYSALHRACVPRR